MKPIIITRNKLIFVFVLNFLFNASYFYLGVKTEKHYIQMQIENKLNPF